MTNFDQLMTDLKVMQIKSKNPDWQSLENLFEKMTQNVIDLKKYDQSKGYHAYLSRLEQTLHFLESESKRKNPNIFQKSEALTETCFGCHATHRNQDIFFKGKPAIHPQ
ncbi:MAG: hypothetical protein JNK65_07400 [Deltaproteobacteria bacterium]|nr:hypothetical protein [Deltaproteobacteria bacterium]